MTAIRDTRQKAAQPSPSEEGVAAPLAIAHSPLTLGEEPALIGLAPFAPSLVVDDAQAGLSELDRHSSRQELARRFEALAASFDEGVLKQPMASAIALDPRAPTSIGAPILEGQAAANVLVLSDLLSAGEVSLSDEHASELKAARNLLSRQLSAQEAPPPLSADQTKAVQLLSRNLSAVFAPGTPADLALRAQARRSVSESRLRMSAFQQSASVAVDDALLAPIEIPSPALVSMERAWSSTRLHFAGMDVTALAQIVMMECAKEHERDLREVLETLRVNNAKKQALRAQITQAKKVRGAAEDEARKEYNRRALLDPRNTLQVDGKATSFEAYFKERELATNVAEAQGDTDVPFALALTNNLTVYPRAGEDAGPPPTLESLGLRADVARDSQKDAYGAAQSAYDAELSGLAQANGVSLDEAKATVQAAVAFSLSNDSAFALRGLYKEAQASGLASELSFEQFVSGGSQGPQAVEAVQARADAMVASINAKRVEQAQALNQTPANYAEVGAKYEMLVRLEMLKKLGDGGRFTALAAQKMDDLQKEIADATKDYSAYQKHLLSADVGSRASALSAELSRAYAEDMAEAKVEYEAHFAAGIAAIATAGAISGGLAVAMYGNPTALAAQAINGGGKYSVDVEKVEHCAYYTGAGEHVKDGWINKFKLNLNHTSRVGQLLMPAVNAAGAEAGDFNQDVLAGGLRNSLSVGIGVMVDDAWPFDFNRTAVAFREDDAGKMAPATILSDPWCNYSSWKNWMDGVGNDVLNAFNADVTRDPGSDQRAEASLVGSRLVSARGGAEIGAPPADPATFAVTADATIDPALQQVAAGPPSAETVATILDAAYTLYPSKAAFTTYVTWLAHGMKNSASQGRAAFADANVDALSRALLEGYETRVQEQREVIDKDNDALFRAREEPPQELERATLQRFDSAVDGLQDAMEGLKDLSEELQIKLQTAMDRRSKMFEMLSNMMKKASSSSDAIIQNMK